MGGWEVEREAGWKVVRRWCGGGAEAVWWRFGGGLVEAHLFAFDDKVWLWIAGLKECLIGKGLKVIIRPVHWLFDQTVLKVKSPREGRRETIM